MKCRWSLSYAGGLMELAAHQLSPAWIIRWWNWNNCVTNSCFVTGARTAQGWITIFFSITIYKNGNAAKRQRTHSLACLLSLSPSSFRASRVARITLHKMLIHVQPFNLTQINLILRVNERKIKLRLHDGALRARDVLQNSKDQQVARLKLPWLEQTSNELQIQLKTKCLFGLALSFVWMSRVAF